ncbi:restriction endonuclease [Deinococcus sp. UYEF24]
MAVPGFQSFFRPILEAVDDGNEYRWRDLREIIADGLELTKEDREDLVPSGAEPRYVNRINWGVTYLSKAGLLEGTRRGHGRITQRGKEFLKRKNGKISAVDLEEFAEYRLFKSASKPTNQKDADDLSPTASLQSPEEQLDALYTELNASLASDLSQQTLQLTPQQFEVLVVRLLVAMGYGGSVRDAGAALGRSGDNGIDGVVKQDPLGLDKVYIQAKQWTNNVGSQEVRNFSGSLTYHKATKGVLITTAGFSSSASDTARQIGNIILIDGPELARLMIEYGVGVITRSTYLVRRVDSEFFEEI